MVLSIKARFSGGFSLLFLTRRASFGTTKYCNSFINGVPCENKDCLYLHTEAPPEDCFLREEMTNGDSKFFQRTHPAYGSLPYSRSLMKRLSSRYGDVLPDRDEPLFFFGVDRLWEEQFVGERKDVRCRHLRRFRERSRRACRRLFISRQIRILCERRILKRSASRSI